jgi:hypothetical protein
MSLEKLKVVMEEVTDPAELAQAQAQRERFDRNWAWFKARATEVYERFRGQCVVIAGEEIFAADEPEAAWALAKATHPEDDGGFIIYVPREKMARIYGYQLFLKTLMASQSNSTEELKIFSSTRESTCGESSDNFGSKAWIKLAKEKGALRLASGRSGALSLMRKHKGAKRYANY